MVTWAEWAGMKTYGDSIGLHSSNIDASRAKKTREALLDGLAKKPEVRSLVVEYQRHLNVIPARNTLGWHAKAEAIYWAMVILEPGHVHLPDCLLDNEGKNLSEDLEAISIAGKLLYAQPYLWSNSVDATVRASPIPPHVIGKELLPDPIMFWSYESAHGPTGDIMDWLCLHDADVGINVLINRVNDIDKKAHPIILASHIPYGAHFPDDFPDLAERNSVEYLLQSLAFIRSAYVRPDSGALPRGLRRVHGIGKPDDSIVKTVLLRREAAVSMDAYNRAADGNSVEWMHHWWVRGHYRAQWRPSNKSHRITWIAPYLKGPLDKPIMPDKVYAVAR